MGCSLKLLTVVTVSSSINSSFCQSSTAGFCFIFPGYLEKGVL